MGRGEKKKKKETINRSHTIQFIENTSLRHINNTKMNNVVCLSIYSCYIFYFFVFKIACEIPFFTYLVHDTNGIFFFFFFVVTINCYNTQSDKVALISNELERVNWQNLLELRNKLFAQMNKKMFYKKTKKQENKKKIPNSNRTAIIKERGKR